MYAVQFTAAAQHRQEIGLQGIWGNILHLEKPNKAQTSDSYHFSLSVARWQLLCTTLRNDQKPMHCLGKKRTPQSYDILKESMKIFFKLVLIP